MRLLLICVSIIAGACGAGDDTTEGTRGACSRGGVLTTCPEIPQSASAACTRMVECGAIPEQKENRFDWAQCVDFVDTRTEIEKGLVIDCIAATACDLLRPADPNNPDPGSIPCIRLGAR
jgi:hypothetical protein